MNLDKIMIRYKGVFIKDFKYSVNNKVFYYNVLTCGGDELMYKYSKQEYEEIECIKECEYWDKYWND
jgi:hypothetical protein